MKGKTILHSFDSLSPDVVKPDPDLPAQVYSESLPARLREPGRGPLPSQEMEDADSTSYRHWGINE